MKISGEVKLDLTSSSSSSSFICQQKHNRVHKVDTNIQLARHTRLRGLTVAFLS